mmetsp:Transcript_107265/g.272237  ORF Transcript_107265/g.272237 Transcript_107265/m.272237 type:complete len:186 (+) Transcript_107265:38-595(+)
MEGAIGVLGLRWQRVGCRQCNATVWQTADEPSSLQTSLPTQPPTAPPAPAVTALPSPSSSSGPSRAAAVAPAVAPPPPAPPAERKARGQKPGEPESLSEIDMCRRCALGMPPVEPELGAGSGLLSNWEIRALQSRDLSPEDYETLLRLDEGIHKKGQMLTEEDVVDFQEGDMPPRWAGRPCWRRW